MNEQIAVVGLGYVGLPVALAFARAFPGTLGYDADPTRAADLGRGRDRNGEVAASDLTSTSLRVTSDEALLRGATFFVIAVPTPVDPQRQPDLSALTAACDVVGRALAPGAVVVVESTVHPGATEEICGPLLERASGLQRGVGFTLGYSPERINPGDREHTLERVTKVVAAEDEATLDRVARAYGAIVEAGVHRAPSIRVAELAKVVENTQRDLNIALMNELAMLCDRLDLPTRDVLAAAATKWNFLPFRPGLVGGHCVGKDPYLLTSVAEKVGYHPEVILAGRRINDNVGPYLAQRLVKLLVEAGRAVAGARVGVLGLGFKENVRDVRNSRVADVVRELGRFGIHPLLHDPLADPAEIERAFGAQPVDLASLADLDALVFAVDHDAYRRLGHERLAALVRPGGVLVDVKSALDPRSIPPHVRYWSF